MYLRSSPTSHHCRCGSRWTDGCLRTSDSNRHSANSVGKERVYGRNLSNRQLQGQPNRHRGPPFLFEIRPGYAMVAQDAAAAGVRNPGPPPFANHQMERIVEPGLSVAIPEDPERMMLLRPRRSRIYYLRRFFDYPISLSGDTLLSSGYGEHGKSASATSGARCFPARMKRRSSNFSSIDSARSCTARSSSPIRKKCGVFPATRSVRSGAPNASKGFPCGLRFRMPFARRSSAEAAASHRRGPRHP